MQASGPTRNFKKVSVRNLDEAQYRTVLAKTAQKEACPTPGDAAPRAWGSKRKKSTRLESIGLRFA